MRVCVLWLLPSTRVHPAARASRFDDRFRRNYTPRRPTKAVLQVAAMDVRVCRPRPNLNLPVYFERTIDNRVRPIRKSLVDLQGPGPLDRMKTSVGNKMRRMVFSDASFLDDAQARGKFWACFGTHSLPESPPSEYISNAFQTAPDSSLFAPSDGGGQPRNSSPSPGQLDPGQAGGSQAPDCSECASAQHPGAGIFHPIGSVASDIREPPETSQ